MAIGETTQRDLYSRGGDAERGLSLSAVEVQATAGSEVLDELPRLEA